MGSRMRQLRKQPAYQAAINKPQRDAEECIRFVMRASKIALDTWRKEAEERKLDYYAHVAAMALGLLDPQQVPELCRTAVKNALFGYIYPADIGDIMRTYPADRRKAAEAIREFAKQKGYTFDVNVKA